MAPTQYTLKSFNYYLSGVYVNDDICKIHYKVDLCKRNPVMWQYLVKIVLETLLLIIQVKRDWIRTLSLFYITSLYPSNKLEFLLYNNISQTNWDWLFFSAGYPEVSYIILDINILTSSMWLCRLALHPKVVASISLVAKKKSVFFCTIRNNNVIPGMNITE